ncbi:MAG: ATP-grasp domain-containing protein, partial [bacterium]
MKIQEYHAREIFKRYGLPVPDSRIATGALEARNFAEEFGFPVVIKAQVLVGGRGKAGGVKIAKDSAEAFEKAGQILGMD